MPIPLTRDELRRKDGRWLLEIDYPGGVLRVADKEATITHNDGTYQYAEGLTGMDLSLQEDLAEISISLAMKDVDFLRGMARGYVLERMSAELSRWYEGQTYERRRVVSTGVLRKVTTGAPGDVARLQGVLTQTTRSLGNPVVMMQVSKDEFNAGSTIITDSLVNTAITDDCPSIGLYVPIVIGYPFWIPALELSMTEETISDSKYPRWALAAHAIEAEDIYLMSDRDTQLVDSSDVNRDVYTANTDLGTRTECRLTTRAPFSTDNQVNTGGKFFWGLNKTTGGGMLNPYRTGALVGLSDVLRYLYDKVGGRKVDEGRFESYAQELNMLEISTWINEPVSVDDWISGHITSVPYPVRIIEGRGGVYARRRTYRPEPTDAVTTLSTAGEGGAIAVARQTGLEPVDVEIMNRVQVNYGPLSAGNTFSKTIEISPQFYDYNETATAISNAFNQMTHICEVSANLFGERMGVVDLRDCWDASTATTIAMELLFMQAMPRYQVTYQGGRDLESLEIGDVVLLTDPELLFESRVATVEDVLFGQALSQVRLEVRTDGLAFDASTS